MSIALAFGAVDPRWARRQAWPAECPLFLGGVGGDMLMHGVDVGGGVLSMCHVDSPVEPRSLRYATGRTSHACEPLTPAAAAMALAAFAQVPAPLRPPGLATGLRRLRGGA